MRRTIAAGLVALNASLACAQTSQQQPLYRVTLYVTAAGPSGLVQTVVGDFRNLGECRAARDNAHDAGTKGDSAIKFAWTCAENGKY